MTPGKLTAAGLEALMREEGSAELREENAILRDCLRIAMGELRFTDLPTSQQALMAINNRLREIR